MAQQSGRNQQGMPRPLDVRDPQGIHRSVAAISSLRRDRLNSDVLRSIRKRFSAYWPGDTGSSIPMSTLSCQPRPITPPPPFSSVVSSMYRQSPVKAVSCRTLQAKAGSQRLISARTRLTFAFCEAAAIICTLVAASTVNNSELVRRGVHRART